MTFAFALGVLTWATTLAEDSVDWNRQAEEDAKQDYTTIIFDGQAPNQLACDTTVRPMPDGSWVTVMLGGGHTEPLPANRAFISRSQDQGKTWSPMRAIDLGIKAKDPTRAFTLSELMLNGNRATMVLQIHNGGFGEWKTFFVHSDDSCHTWSELEPAPGKLADRTMLRNAIKTRDGRILMPYQHYNRCDEQGRKISKGRVIHTPRDPRNGVIESQDGGLTWDIYGDIRLTDDANYHGWAEPNIVELSDGTIAMIIRADRLGGVLYYAESRDGGRTWPAFAKKTKIPNPGSKATLYGLGGDTVALLHNPNPHHRSPLALWISFDGLKTWPYRRVLVPESWPDQLSRRVCQRGRTVPQLCLRRQPPPLRFLPSKAAAVEAFHRLGGMTCASYTWTRACPCQAGDAS